MSQSTKEIKSPFLNLRDHLESATADYSKFTRGNMAAGKRARRSLLEIAKLAKEIRASISVTDAVKEKKGAERG